MHTRDATQAIVGKGKTFTLLEDEALKPYLDKLEPADGGAAPGEAMEARAPPMAQLRKRRESQQKSSVA